MLRDAGWQVNNKRIERPGRRVTLTDLFILRGVPLCGTGEVLGCLIAHDIDPHIPAWDKSKREDGTYSRAMTRSATSISALAARP